MINFEQQMRVTEINGPRTEWLAVRYREARVLHVGCADWPICDPETNLHMKLAARVRRLDGFDTSPEGLAWIREKMPADYFTSMADVLKSARQYEAIIAPEVIEHVGDARTFLEQLFWPNAREVLVTAPNALSAKDSLLFDDKTGYYRETVHPEHIAWYSPYTLLNAVKAVTPPHWNLEVFLLETRTQVAVVARMP